MAKKAARQTLIQRSRRVSPAEKAGYQVFGNKGTVRDFFGLSEKDEQAIEQEIGKALDVNLQRQSQG